MKKFLSNPWLWVTVAATGLFCIAPVFGVKADIALEFYGLLLFFILSAAFVKYIARASSAVWAGDMSRVARQIVGTTILLFGLMYQRLYNGVSRQFFDRADWLNELYWAAGGVFIIGAGFLLMASAAFSPLAPKTKANRLSSYLFGFLSATAVFLSGALPTIISKLSAVWVHLISILPK